MSEHRGLPDKGSFQGFYLGVRKIGALPAIGGVGELRVDPTRRFAARLVSRGARHRGWRWRDASLILP